MNYESCFEYYADKLGWWWELFGSRGDAKFGDILCPDRVKIGEDRRLKEKNDYPRDYGS
jgi:hypothetical protein